MSTRSAIDFEDIQGLVRFAHGSLSEAAFLLLRITDQNAARKWLADANISRAGATSPRPTSAMQLAFTASGLAAMGVANKIIDKFSEDFTTGLSNDDNRSRRLGDIGANHPSQWRWGGTQETSPHLLLMIYTPGDELDRSLQDLHQGLFDTAFDTLDTLISKTTSREEPFGFIDGISQPEIDWQQAISTDAHDRDSYSNLLALGETLLGYPNEYGLYTERPLLNPQDVQGIDALPNALEHPFMKDLGRNGTYLVLRQLAQDVTGFWQFLDQQSGTDPTERDKLAAAMVGRQRDGRPLVGAATAGTTTEQNNAFNFDQDPQGRQCPIGSHIRRANPRSGDFPPQTGGFIGRLIRTLGFGRRHARQDLVASSRFHRILRRGRVYGSVLTPEQALQAAPAAHAEEERGLIFVCLGANLSRQFEFVQSAWSMSSKFAGLPTESDPLLGNRETLVSGARTDVFTQPQSTGPARRTESIPQFVTVRGGAYFFMPGLRALEFILQQAALNAPAGDQ